MVDAFRSTGEQNFPTLLLEGVGGVGLSFLNAKERDFVSFTEIQKQIVLSYFS